MQPQRGWKWKVLEHNEDHFPFLMLPQIFTWSIQTRACIPLSIQPEVCKQRWEIVKKKKEKEISGNELGMSRTSAVWTCFSLGAGKGRTDFHLSPSKPSPPLPTPSNQNPMSFLLCGQQIWPSVELVSWHLISPLPGQMASEITEGDRMSCPVCLHPVTCTSLWKYWANDKGEPFRRFTNTPGPVLGDSLLPLFLSVMPVPDWPLENTVFCDSLHMFAQFFLLWPRL